MGAFRCFAKELFCFIDIAVSSTTLEEKSSDNKLSIRIIQVS